MGLSEQRRSPNGPPLNTTFSNVNFPPASSAAKKPAVASCVNASISEFLTVTSTTQPGSYTWTVSACAPSVLASADSQQPSITNVPLPPMRTASLDLMTQFLIVPPGFRTTAADCQSGADATMVLFRSVAPLATFVGPDEVFPLNCAAVSVSGIVPDGAGVGSGAGSGSGSGVGSTTTGAATSLIRKPSGRDTS